MSNRAILITGPTSGLGREMAFQLAGQGASLILACRDDAAGARTAEDIRDRHPRASVLVRHVDVSSPTSIRSFAVRLKQDIKGLDVLVNNAGVHHWARRPSPEGLESTFATNVLGTHVMSRELLNLLKAGRAARIVNVASSFAKAPDLDDLQFTRRPFDGRLAYQESKAADRMLTRAWARRLQESGIAVNSMAPGLVQTGLFRDTPTHTRLLIRLAGLCFGRSLTQGADTAVWLATSPDVEGRSGGFYSRRVETPCEFNNTDAEERLWSACEDLAAH